MTIEALTTFFVWCSIINIGLLLLWSFFLLFAPTLNYKTQKMFLDASEEDLRLFFYCFMAQFKLLLIVFNITPFLVLHFFL